MSEQELKDLFDRYLKDQCTPREKKLLDALFESFRKMHLRAAWMPKNPDRLRASLLKNIKKGISIDEKRLDKHRQVKNVQPSTVLSPWRIAASIALIIGFSIMGYFGYVNFTKVEWITKTTTHGQRATILLADGSRVRLNAESTLIYPKDFSTGHREVKIVGEAFFDVVRDDTKPFMVSSGDVMTTVLGTSFNVSAFPKEAIEVSVATGKVAVRAISFSKEQTETTELTHPDVKEVFITPGFKATYDPISQALTALKTDLDIELAWKMERLTFSGFKLDKIAKMLEERYQVDIRLLNDNLRACGLSYATFGEESFLEIMNNLSEAMDFEFEVVATNQVEINGPGCGQ